MKPLAKAPHYNVIARLAMAENAERRPDASERHSYDGKKFHSTRQVFDMYWNRKWREAAS